VSNTNPNLFILGVAKAGTTTLADSLREHPDIFITPSKEPTFFSSDANYEHGMEWYINNFFKTSESYRYRGEASPSYIYFAEKVAHRIETCLKGEAIKFIVIFRNPVERAYSHYWHNVNRGLLENLSFEDALQAEDERLKSQNSLLNSLGRIRYAYFNAGLYTKQLKLFWDIFPRENFLLLLHEDLYVHRHVDTMNTVQAFLQLPPIKIEYKHSNSSYRPRSHVFQNIVRKPSMLKDLIKLILPAKNRASLKGNLLRINAAPVAYPPMNPDTRESLRARYFFEVKELQNLIERDLSAWLK
jgi:hypothetical protein